MDDRFLHEARREPRPEFAAGLRSGDLAGLEAHVRSELREAVIQLEPERISSVIERITNENAALGSTLASYAARYAYTPIIKALDSV